MSPGNEVGNEAKQALSFNTPFVPIDVVPIDGVAIDCVAIDGVVIDCVEGRKGLADVTGAIDSGTCRLLLRLPFKPLNKSDVGAEDGRAGIETLVANGVMGDAEEDKLVPSQLLIR